ncbi:hypothetical protein [Bacillus fonticola]|uniref:hypothetical protein n=1 Tax=Bacillus fonticola TaxID=2728853 RepID=UPI00147444A1|nr:hypothetical protein [Bacillus fonticola]
MMWTKRKSRRNRKRQTGDRYNFSDFIVDALFFVPELIMYPLRLLLWVGRGIGRFFDWL